MRVENRRVYGVECEVTVDQGVRCEEDEIGSGAQFTTKFLHLGEGESIGDSERI